MILMNEELSTRKFFLRIFSTSETCVEISRATRAKGTLTSLRKTSSFCLRPIHKLLCSAFNKWLKAIFQKHTQFLFSFLLRCLYMKEGKDLTTSTSSSNSITSRILVQKLYSHLVMKFLLPNFRRKDASLPQSRQMPRKPAQVDQHSPQRIHSRKAFQILLLGPSLRP